MPASTELAVVRPSRLPVAVAHDLRFYLAKLYPPVSPGVTRYEIEAHDAPPPAVRAMLEERVAYLTNWLRPAGEAVSGRHYATLSVTMAMPERPEAVAQLHMRAWIADAATVPAFALDQACAAVRQGSVGDGEWMPKVGVVVAEARRLVVPYAREKREIEALISATVVAPRLSAEQRAAITEAAKVRLKPMAGKNDGSSRGSMTAGELEDCRRVAAGVVPRPDPLASLSAEALAQIPDAPKRAEPNHA